MQKCILLFSLKKSVITCHLVVNLKYYMMENESIKKYKPLAYYK